MGSNTDVVEQAQGVQTSSEGVAFEWRRERYEELGFNSNEAIALASSKSLSTTGGKDNAKKLTWSVPLHWGRVKKALDAGATHTQVLEIFVTDMMGL